MTDDKEKDFLMDLARFCDITWYQTKEQWKPNVGKYPYIREFPEEVHGHCAVYYETDESNPICWDINDPISKNTIAMLCLKSKYWDTNFVLQK
jgi:hypothetical protein